MHQTDIPDRTIGLAAQAELHPRAEVWQVDAAIDHLIIGQLIVIRSAGINVQCRSLGWA